MGTIPPATLIEMFPPKEKLGKGCPICEENKWGSVWVKGKVLDIGCPIREEN